MLPHTLSFVDLETTGTNATFNRIIEIGILKVQENKLVREYKQLINPETRVDPFIEKMTGINSHELEHAPTFAEIKDEVFEILKDSVFVAHNVRFDYGFLRNEFRRFDISFKLKHFCTVKLARILYPHLKKFNLDSIIANFNIDCVSRHRAFDDAKVLWDFYQKSRDTIENAQFEKAVNIALRRPTVPVNLSEDLLDDLPETPGVYIFYGADNTILYIGKSVNIHDRVLSHFSNDLLSAVDMKIAQQITHVETISTAGELGALLLESALIKKHQPIYNRLLRQSRKMMVLLKTTDENGYLGVQLSEMEVVDIDHLDQIIGVFRTQKQVKDFLHEIAKEYHLCPKLLGLEKTKSYCFYFQLGICNGACRNEEIYLKYNLRFDEAFYKHKIRPWRFDGPIVLKEESTSHEAFIVDKWCLLGNAKNDEELSDVSSDYVFDYDAYKILSKFILKPPKSLSISILKRRSFSSDDNSETSYASFLS